jgi:CHASE1-domain containing sensor protein
LPFLRRHWSALLVAAAGIALSLCAFLAIRAELGERHRLELEWLARDRNRALTKGIEEGLDAVRALRDLFRAAGPVDAQALDLFSRALFERYQGIQAYFPAQLIPSHGRLPNIEPSPFFLLFSLFP